MNTETVNIALNKALVQKAEHYIKAEGIPLAESIEIFLTQIVRHEGKPLSEWITIIPNTETLAALEEAKRLACNPNIKGYSNVEEALHELKK